MCPDYRPQGSKIEPSRWPDAVEGPYVPRLALALLFVVACDRSQEDHVAPTASPAVADRAPLRIWMKTELVARLKHADYDRLAAALTALAAVRPPGFERWEAIAREGAHAASKHDLEAVRHACLTCHQAYRQRVRDLGLALAVGSS
jgi:hypothetical protein